MLLTTAQTTKSYAFRRIPGPVAGTWIVTLACAHGVTSCYLAAHRLRMPDEGVAVLQLLATRHRRDRPMCHCLTGSRR